MAKVHFVNVEPFSSNSKDLKVSYHILSSIKISSKHYVALCEMAESSKSTWVWTSETDPLEQEGITVKWRKGKVTFASQGLQKLSNDREYFLMCCNENGTILGESQRFKFLTDSDELSSIDLQSTTSKEVVMISMNGKKAPPPTSEISLHNGAAEQTYTDTPEPTIKDKETEKGSCQSVASKVVPKNTSKPATAAEGNNTKDDDKLPTLIYSCTETKKTKKYQNVPAKSNQETSMQLQTHGSEKIREYEEQKSLLLKAMSGLQDLRKLGNFITQVKEFINWCDRCIAEKNVQGKTS